MEQTKNILKGYFSVSLEIGDDGKDNNTLLDSIYERIEDPKETGVVIDESRSEIRQFYCGKVVLVTGVTGCIGTSVVEKLLRSCPIKKLYILIRPKRGKTIEERVKKIFDDIFFEEMKCTTMDWRGKVVPIMGDISKKGLGISSENRSMLIKDTNVIIHLAANVKFNANLAQILKSNVLGTHELMDIAQECQKLQAFVYVSTAYSQCQEKFHVREKFYEPPISLEYARELASKDPKSFTKEVTQTIIQPFPNTYSFSKSIAEDVVRQRSKGLVACVVRPSICGPIYHEPLKGWTNSFGGFNLMGVLAGIGVLHIGCAPPENKLDVIPTDFCSHAVIAAAWDADASYVDEPLVYNVTPAQEKRTTFRNILRYTATEMVDNATLKTLWVPFDYTTSNIIMFRILDFIVHFLPALLVDLCLLCSGRKRRTLSLYWKGQEYLQLTLFYIMESWRFDTTRKTELCQKLNTADKALFPFDDNYISFDLWGYMSWRGCRVYLLKDPMTTLSSARAKMFKLRILNYVVVTSFVAMVAYYFWKAAGNALSYVLG